MLEGGAEKQPRKIEAGQLRGVKIPRPNTFATLADAVLPLADTAVQKMVLRSGHAKREKEISTLKEGERLPNEWERGAVDAVNEILAKEFERIEIVDKDSGASLYTPLKYEQLHIVTGREFLQEEPGSILHGQHDLTTGVIMMPEKTAPEKFLHTLVHEMLHAAGFATAGFKGSSATIGKLLSGITIRRSGYDMMRARKRDGMPVPPGMYFQSWNEAVVESMTRRLVHDEGNMLAKRLGIDPTQFELHGSYDNEVNLLKRLVPSIARYTNKSEEQWRTEIERGHFTGDMMHLRTIERAFDENALFLISLLSTRQLHGRGMPGEVMSFLESNDDIVRLGYAQNILSSGDFLHYLAHSYSRSIARFLRRPMPDAKNKRYENALKRIVNIVRTKVVKLRQMSSATVNINEAHNVVRTQELDVEQRLSDYEKRFGTKIEI